MQKYVKMRRGKKKSEEKKQIKSVKRNIQQKYILKNERERERDKEIEENTGKNNK